MGLLKEIDEQICGPCRRNMEKPGEDIRQCCDETCPLERLYTMLSSFGVGGKVSQALRLKEAL